MIGTPLAHSQTYSKIHDFTGGSDGAFPGFWLTVDNAGNLYGVTWQVPCGTVFKLAHQGAGWVLSTLYKFAGGSDGCLPSGGVTIGPDGSVYGFTDNGGVCNAGGCGTVFNLKPPAGICKKVFCPWNHSVLYRFTGNGDGTSPGGNPVFDASGNLYGVTQYGGGICDPDVCGTVFQLSRSGSGWAYSAIYRFTGSGDGAIPVAGVVFDESQTSLYGTTLYQDLNGGCGTIFQLTPQGNDWVENTLHAFHGSDGCGGADRLVFDNAGNLYGTAGPGGGGTAFQLTPSDDGWTFAVIHSFSNKQGPDQGAVAVDSAGHLYGAACDGGAGFGAAYQLMRSGGGWQFTSLHQFTSGIGGNWPTGVTVSSAGVIYGATVFGGSGSCLPQLGCGVIWQITP